HRRRVDHRAARDPPARRPGVGRVEPGRGRRLLLHAERRPGMKPHPPTILLVEDNADDEALTVRALHRTGLASNLDVARDGEQALNYLLDRSRPLPQLVLLDLKLPKIDGLDVL